MNRINWNGMAVLPGLVVMAAVLTVVAGVRPAWAPTTPPDKTCIACHESTTPGIVTDWKLSKHAQKGVGCEACHGTAHMSADDAAKAGLADYETCNRCHEKRVKEFKAGKHALSWKAATNMPNFPHISKVQIEGGKGCGGCHKFGLKDEKELSAIKAAGTAPQSSSCDACHTRHTFSRTEALQPQACQTCHQGEDHPLWDVYSYSKHGVRSVMKQVGALPKDAGAPTCQTCHMPKGDHEAMTSWGLFGLRLPLPDDPKWAADRVTIFQAMGLFGMDGKPTPAIEGAKKLGLFRFTNEEWQKERDKMIKTCAECHTLSYAKAELAKGDTLVREADSLMAQGIRIVADLYKDGIVKKPDSYPAPFPMILTFHEAPNPAEAKLFLMFLNHRSMMYIGAFHGNPEYPVWFGYSEMLSDLYEIRKEAAELRKEKH